MIRHHLDVFTSPREYDPVRAGIAEDLRNQPCPIEPVLARIDPLLATPRYLRDDEFQCLVDFVREGLLDRRAEPAHFRNLVPQFLPSGRPPLQFQFEAFRP